MCSVVCVWGCVCVGEGWEVHIEGVCVGRG